MMQKLSLSTDAQVPVQHIRSHSSFICQVAFSDRKSKSTQPESFPPALEHNIIIMAKKKKKLNKNKERSMAEIPDSDYHRNLISRCSAEREPNAHLPSNLTNRDLRGTTSSSAFSSPLNPTVAERAHGFRVEEG